MPELTPDERATLRRLRAVLSKPGAKLVVAPDIYESMSAAADRLYTPDGPNDAALRSFSGIEVIVNRNLPLGCMIPLPLTPSPPTDSAA